MKAPRWMEAHLDRRTGLASIGVKPWARPLVALIARVRSRLAF